MEIELNNNKYKVIKNYKDGFDKEEFLNRVTDYYYDYDYIVGDYAYGKLRLKGFTNKSNKLSNNINKEDLIDDYIKNYCAFECKYYILKKENIG